MRVGLLSATCLLLGLSVLAAQTAKLGTLEIAIKGEILDTAVADFDGDERGDVLILTKKRELLLFLQSGDGSSFGAPVRVDFPAGTSAFAIADLVAPKGADVVLLSSEGVSIAALSKGGRALTTTDLKLPLVFPPGYRGDPRFWGWGEDLNDDGWDDLLLPGLTSDAVVYGRGEASSSLASVPIPSPITERLQESPSGTMGLRRLRPRIAFHPVIAKDMLSPVFMDDSGLRVLEGSLATGITEKTRLLFPVRKTEGNPLDILQRLDVTLEDLNRDELADLILARTRADRTSRSFEQRTQLLFFLNSRKPSSTPSQLIVLPGVLSNGPYLRDVDGDGRTDLFFSVYGGKLSNNIARLVLRNVRLEYHLYLGRGGSEIFPRSPDLTIADKIPLEAFDTWNLRHRVFLQSDWNSDGKLDQVRIAAADGDDLRVEIIPTLTSAATISFAKKPLARLQVNGPFEGHTHHELSKGRPAIQFKAKDRLVFVTLVPGR